ncbi:uncharacterized protein LOC143274831 [Babylonia areolata]|uniref:uncharacterized protein LOC143274831 n=1 Tax=Babylonia areolata TaxID=304850 RepID=UPI003FD1CDC0
MTSLCPGSLFQSSGLNHHSTPTPPTATPSEIDQKLTRQPFNGHDWPRDSPVARVYDVGNTSTSLVLLNRRRKKKCQLRGLTLRNGEFESPAPRRHLSEEPSVNWQHHRKCVVSVTEPFKPQVNLDLGWVNNRQRPPVRFDGGSHVNHRRHTSCRVTGDSPVLGWRGLPRRPATTTAASTTGVDSELRAMSPMLNDPDISQGGRRYLYSIARIYSTSQMKQLKQDQYQQLLLKELSKGYRSPKEYERYLNYLNTPRKTQYGKLDNYEELRRSKSVPPPVHGDDSGRGGESGKGGKKQKRSAFSRAPSQVSSSSRPSTRQRGGGKKKAQRQQSPLPPSGSKPAADSDDTRQHSSEPESDEDPTDHTRKEEESETGDDSAELLSGIRESEENSYRSKDKSTADTIISAQKEPEPESSHTQLALPPPATKDDDGASPRKEEEEGGTARKDDPSPRKGEEEETPRKNAGGSGGGATPSEGKEDRSSEGAVTSTTQAPPPSSSTATSNNFLAFIVSDAEKDDNDSRAAAAVDEDGSEQEKQSSAEETTTPATSTAATTQPGMARDFSDTHMATGHTPRVNKEGRTRPLSRAGRGTEQGAEGEKENSDDDYDDTDDETEKTATKTETAKTNTQTETDKTKTETETEKTNTKTETEKTSKEATKEKEESQQEQLQQQQKKEEGEKEEEPVQRSALEPEPQTIPDTSRTDDSQAEQRGEMGGEEEARTEREAEQDRRAGSPSNEAGRDDERAQESHDREGPRSLIIPVSQHAQDTATTTTTTATDTSSATKKEEVLDLSAESKNRDVDKLEY